jgi:putative Mg2+ transporter-C (MgtC) family protein
MTVTSIEDYALRMLVALVLGSLIGAERQFRQRLAGLRTNALVCVGAALFVSMSALDVHGDPMRIAAQVVSGIGFLAGGVIFREGLSVQGLNTAATLWSTAAVGSLAGFGYTIQAVIGTAVILFVHIVMRPLVGAINARPDAGAEIVVTFEFHAVCRQDVEERVRTVLISAVRRAKITLLALYSDDVVDSAMVEVVADVAIAGVADEPLESVVTKLGIEPGVTSVSWRQVPATKDEREMLPVV